MVKRYSTAEVARICDRSQRTILRWREDGLFSKWIQVKDGYIFPGDSIVKCFKSIKNGKEKAMTIQEIEKRFNSCKTVKC